jgi:hypothetical protein
VELDILCIVEIFNYCASAGVGSEIKLNKSYEMIPDVQAMSEIMLKNVDSLR